MNILLTNDDGHDALGLAALYELARELGEVIVVAPDRQHSRQSHAITTTQPIALRSSGRFERGWCCTGTPADCVRLGLLHLPVGRVDLVMAGINHGGNLGVEVFYSGTVAAAREAALQGVPAIALSQLLRDGMSEDWAASRRMASRAVAALCAKVAAAPAPGQPGALAARGESALLLDPARLPPLSSINLPAPAGGQPRGVMFCPLALTPMDVRYQPATAATASSAAVQFCGRYFERAAPPGSDVHAVVNDWIAITLMNADGSAWQTLTQAAGSPSVRWEP